ETIPEIERYAEEGIVTVDMEAAALFAVAEYRDVEAGALFTVSDYLGPDEWDPRFDATDEHLQQLFDVATAAVD
ncbi:MAG: uridine phosphorylase, partial [Halobacteriales archaeon]